MASSSSPPHAETQNSSSRRFTPYDVFINHRGGDVKMGLASHIHNSLVSHGIRVFLDKDEMERGEPITEQIQDAIQTSSVHIAIFSKNYAESRWCLDELCWMMKNDRTKILPVFYDVEPSDLRWIHKGHGSYAKAFEVHQEKRDGEKLRYSSLVIQEWKAALSAVPETSGYELKTFNGLDGCWSLGIPEGILRNISTLEYIDFSRCREMTVLPSQISHQKSLKQIKLNCTSLTELPKDIGNLSILENLELESDVLTSLPHSIWNLSGLTKLKLNRCRMLDCLPHYMASSGEVYLPPRVEKMKNLEYLEIRKCPLRDAVTPFTKVDGLFPELQRLLLREAEIPRISITKKVCPHLKRLDLSWNSRVVKVEALPKTLESLLLCNCKALERIGENVHLPKLCELDVRGCCELQYLPNFAHLSALETLNADGCWKMKRMRGLEQLKRLKYLRISADNGDIWKDIRFLQMRSPSGSSTTSLTLRAVPGGEDGVEAILNSLPSHLRYVKPKSRGNEFSVQMRDIKFCTSAVMCFVLLQTPDYPVFFGQAGSFGFDVHIESLISPFDDDSPRTNYGKWINMSLFTEGSCFFRKLKDHGHYADVLRIHIPATATEITNGWMVTGRNGEEDEIVEVWSKLTTHMQRRCLSHYAGSVE